MALQQPARAAEQIAVGICRLEREQLVEQVNGAEVIEERPPGEARTGERGDAVGIVVEPRRVARQDRRLRVRVHRRDHRRHPCIVAKGVRVLPNEELSLDATPITLDFCRVCVDDAGEFVDRLLVTRLIDEELTLLRGAGRAVCRRDRSVDEHRDGDHDRNDCTHRLLHVEARLYQMAELAASSGQNVAGDRGRLGARRTSSSRTPRSINCCTFPSRRKSDRSVRLPLVYA